MAGLELFINFVLALGSDLAVRRPCGRGFAPSSAGNSSSALFHGLLLALTEVAAVSLETG